MRAMRAAMRLRSGGGSGLPERKPDAQRRGDLACRRLDAREAGLVVLDDQPAADRNGAGCEDAAVLDEGELGGSAADIDVEHGCIAAARQRDGTGSVCRHLAFHMVARGGADELAGFFREQVGNGARIAALECLAGEDDGAAVDRLALDPGEGVATADEACELVDVDRVVGPVGREQDRRLPEDAAADDDEAAGQRGRQPLQMDACEHQMRGR